MDEISKQAVSLLFNVRDSLDYPDHAVARELRASVQRFVDEIETKKGPRSLEATVSQIIRQLEAAEGLGIVSNHHLEDFRDRSEDIRRALREQQ